MNPGVVSRCKYPGRKSKKRPLIKEGIADRGTGKLMDPELGLDANPV